MSRLALTFLGPPLVLLDGEPVELKRRKPLALLAYLAVTSQTRSRDVLTEILYPDHPRDQGYSDFRQTLTVLRKTIGEKWLIADQGGVRLRHGKDLWVDVTEFRRLIQGTKNREKPGGPSGSEKLLSRAAALVHGRFLEGFSLKDSPEFEDWQSMEADSLLRDQTWVLERLVDLHQSREEYREAIEPCQKWLSLDSFDEAVHSRLMRLYLLSGQRSLALKQYERCRAILERELGEKPGKEMEELRQQILRERLELRKVHKTGDTVFESFERTSAHSLPFVGRERELAVLKAAYEGAHTGQGRLVLIAGEAGIGKTRLIEEATTRAHAGGARVIWGRCYADAGLPACWPWPQVLGQLAKDSQPDRVRVWAGDRADVLGSLVTDLHEVIGKLSEPQRLDSAESERFRLSEAVARFLRLAAEEQTLILVLDDLHCADSAALGILEFITRGLAGTRVLALAACRNLESDPRRALGRALDELARERSFERIELDALGREQVTELAQRSSEAALPPGFADALWERTRGNALFVVESLRFRRQDTSRREERSETSVGELPIPPGVRALIRRELHGVSPGCYELLETAAVLGAEFTIEKLGRALKLSGPDLLSSVDEAVRARFLSRQRKGTAEILRFSHPLMQETISEELTLSRRTALHAGIAQSLEELYGGEREDHAIELAWHYDLAQQLAPADKLTRYALVAGEQELKERAYEEAVLHFQRGLAVKGSGTNDAETAWLRFGLARALPKAWLTTYFEIEYLESGNNSFAGLTAAFDFFMKTGDVDNAVKIAAHPLVLHSRRSGELTTLADRGLEIVRSGSIDEARLIRLNALVDFSRTGDYSVFCRRLEKAVDVAQHHGDTLLELSMTSSWVMVAAEHTREATADRVKRAQELLRLVDDPVAEYYVHYQAYHVALSSGNMSAAVRYAEAIFATADRLRSDEHMKVALDIRLELCLVRGDWTGMRAASDKALAVKSDSVMFRRQLARRANLELEVGDSESGNRFTGLYLAELKGKGFHNDLETSWTVHEFAHMARLTGDQELLNLARTAAAAVIRPGQEHLVQGAAVRENRARVGLALAVHLQGDRETAGRLRQWYSENGECWMVGLQPTRMRLLGLLDLTLGDADAAVGELEHALVDYAPFRPGPEVAWIISELAEALLARAKEGDPARAAVLLQEGLAMAATLGMIPLIARYRRLMERVPPMEPKRRLAK